MFYIQQHHFPMLLATLFAYQYNDEINKFLGINALPYQSNVFPVHEFPESEGYIYYQNENVCPGIKKTRKERKTVIPVRVSVYLILFVSSTLMI